MSSVTPAGSVSSATKPGVVPVFVATTVSAVAARPMTAASATVACQTWCPVLVSTARIVPSLAGCRSESPVTIGPPTANRLDAYRHRSAPDAGSKA